MKQEVFYEDVLCRLNECGFSFVCSGIGKPSTYETESGWEHFLVTSDPYSLDSQLEEEIRFIASFLEDVATTDVFTTVAFNAPYEGHKGYYIGHIYIKRAS